MKDVQAVTTAQYHDSAVVRDTKRKVHELIERVALSEEGGNWFFRSDTGSGKTTGYIDATMNSPHAFAIAVPTMEDVDAIHQAFEDAGCPFAVKWHTESGTLKELTYDAKIVIGTHNWLLGKVDPTKHIGDGRILIVDEVPGDAITNAIVGSQITHARERAGYYALKCADNFRQAEAWVQDRKDSGDVRPDFKKVTFKGMASLKAAEAEINSHTVPIKADREHMRLVLSFLSAASDGRAYERKTFSPSTGGYAVYYAWFEFKSGWFDKSIIFSATTHLDGFQFHKDAARLDDVEGSLVDYSNLEFVHVPWLKGVDKNTDQVVSRPKQLRMALDHIQSMFDLGTGSTLLVVPKKIKEHLAEKFNAVQITESVFKGRHKSREVFITNWGRDVGSNAYRDCETVILWNNQHKPKHTVWSELLVMAEERVEPKNLEEVKGGKFRGRPLGLQQGQLYAAIKQMGCRGTARKIDDNGVCYPMKLIMSWDDLDPDKLNMIFPNHRYHYHNSKRDGFDGKVPNKIEHMVVHELTSRYQAWAEVPLSELSKQLTRVQRETKKFVSLPEFFARYGWAFVPPTKGKAGGGSKFINLNLRG